MGGESLIGRTQLKEIKCLCGDRMQVWLKNPFRRSIDQYRCDVHMICPDCGYKAVFGVHVTEEEFGKMSREYFPLPERYGKVWNLKPLLRNEPPELNKSIRCLCGNDEFFFKEFHLIEQHDGQFYARVFLKCSECAFVPFFDINISRELFDELKKKVGVRLDYRRTGHWTVTPVRKPIETNIK